MKNFLIAFLIFLIWAVFGLWLYSWFGNKSAEPTATVTETRLKGDTLIQNDATDINETETSSALSTTQQTENTEVFTNGFKAVTPDNAIIFQLNKGITITKNDPEIVVSPSAIDFKYLLNTYFLEHPDEELQINPLYSAEENIMRPNLGVQRGNQVKKILEEIGLPGNKIVVRPVIKEIPFDADGKFTNSISFSFKPLDSNRMESLKSDIPEKRIVYPRFSNTGLLDSEELRNLLREVTGILNENADITIEIVGHTDNIGNDLDNYRAALEHARQLRWYLINKGGIKRERITATSRGETEPIDNNETASGRKKNKRIEVIFN